MDWTLWTDYSTWFAGDYLLLLAILLIGLDGAITSIFHVRLWRESKCKTPRLY